MASSGHSERLGYQLWQARLPIMASVVKIKMASLVYEREISGGDLNGGESSG